MSIWSRVANVFRGDRISREIDEEFAAHIDEAVAEGRDAAEARRPFGSALRQREESRDARVIGWMEEAGWIRAEWVTKETGRRARLYELTAAGKKQLGAEESRWVTVTSAVNRVLRTI
jgi:hypothetical protein